MERRRPLLCSLAALVLAGVFPLSAQDLVEKMEVEHAQDQPISNPMSDAGPALSVTGSEVVYADVDGKDISGYLAQPADGRSLAAVIVIHEWWGLNDNVRAMADRLAGEGYAALAVDLYEGEVADSRDGASALMRSTLERGQGLESNLRQAYGYLTRDVGVGSVGVIGWCFGGGWSLRTALLMGDRISAAVIYYGRLVTDPDALAPLNAPILGLFGGLDRGIPVESVREFESALEALGKNAAIHIYPDADHAFGNPSGTRYNEAAATDAWNKTLEFFGRHLQ